MKSLWFWKQRYNFANVPVPNLSADTGELINGSDILIMYHRLMKGFPNLIFFQMASKKFTNLCMNLYYIKKFEKGPGRSLCILRLPWFTQQVQAA